MNEEPLDSWVQELLNKMKVAAQDEKRFAVLDLDFHVALAKASGAFGRDSRECSREAWLIAG
jgi:DNA-binding GntR family transcriptional regulator